MASKKSPRVQYQTLKPEDVQEVADYETSLRVLDLFMDEHKDVMADYKVLVEESNQKLEKAAEIVRSRKVNCGDFHVHTTITKYDVDRLLSIIGQDNFLQIGGTSNTRVSWEIDKAKLELAAETGALDEETVEAVRTVSVSFKIPKPR